MDHVAILKKDWKLLDRILSGEKRVESRWYIHKRDPWDKIKKGDVVFLKESGSPVSAKARVSKVLQFADLNRDKVDGLLREFSDVLGISDERFSSVRERLKKKRYGILIFLEDPRKIKPFHIDKRGFGLMSAWLCVEDITSLIASP